MSVKHHVYLVPGFFGFTNLGELLYFGHAYEFLKQDLARRGVDAEVVTIVSHPTASIRQRTADLLKAVSETASGDDGPIHLVGHSTGGLDARLFVSPGAQVSDALELEPFARRVRSVVTLSAPHAGTPLATFFLGLFGQQLLKLLSLFTMYVLRFGRLPLSVVFRFGHLMSRADDQLGWKATLLDQLFDQLLGDFSSERRDAVTKFLWDVGRDTSLIPQLTPEGIDLFNGGTHDRPGVRYGSVVTQARPPSLRTRLAAGLDPYAQLTHTIYAFVYGQTQRMPLTQLPLHTPAQTAALVQAYGAMPGPTACDGIVPTRSQVYGRVLTAVRADHLDAIGHFDQPAHQPPHVDWLISGSGFRRPQFEAMWKTIGDFLMEEEPAK
ncbi:MULTISPECIES: esterase/lipase family protein [unclassified Corallococcus]|uniref:esterase/lipase family protein n=1 Tax=unclassified Corallococcus TaxID=2685029 RepID=UPI001A902C2B|nr:MULTISPECIES: triacylglycerol lipase [unclassified Corallococcus]MBN9688454.1 triacylglycerol lipase [Corallococcus sp. NCSPR001]WAS87745.1 triacylglycerol lipase [Corallococcus sp. NCRR]